MKAKKFWEFMCDTLDFRFYTGTPIYEFKKLFDTMTPDILHYVPTTNEESAIGLASGAYLSGIKGAVFMQTIYFDKLKLFIKEFNEEHNIPILLIVENSYNPLGLKQFDIASLEEMENYLYKGEHKPCILIIKEGDIS